MTFKPILFKLLTSDNRAIRVSKLFDDSKGTRPRSRIADRALKPGQQLHIPACDRKLPASRSTEAKGTVHGSIDYDSLSLNFSAKERKDQRNEKHPSSTPKKLINRIIVRTCSPNNLFSFQQSHTQPALPYIDPLRRTCLAALRVIASRSCVRTAGAHHACFPGRLDGQATNPTQHGPQVMSLRGGRTVRVYARVEDLRGCTYLRRGQC